MTQPLELLAFAEAAVDQVEPVFKAGIGAEPVRVKGAGDFATEVDLQIEATLRSTLTQMTGIPVYGEESGGDLGETTWVVDPVDGTANYSAGNPLCGVLIALVHHGEPIVAVADFPLLGRRLACAEGTELRFLGGPATGFGGGMSSFGFDEARGHVGCSSHLATGIFNELRETGLRPRMTGSVGLDNAFVAQGVFDGAVNFSPHPWDNAAGALLIRAAGGVVTDPHGNDWTVESKGMVAGTTQVHATIVEAIRHHEASA
ncbi:inositol monophosphatase family protein [Corynebacterium camporealensis]